MRLLALAVALTACSSPSAGPQEPEPPLAVAIDASLPEPASPDAAPPGPVCTEVERRVGEGALGYIARGENCEGLREGAWRYTAPDGALVREGSFAHDREDGPWRFYYSSGRLRSEGAFSRGRREGLWKRYHEDGTMSLEGAYRDGLREGRWRRWHPNGVLYEDRRYQAGRREGIHEKWNEDGERVLVRECADDRCTVVCKARKGKACPSPTSVPGVP